MSKALFEQRVEQHLTSIYEGVDLCMSIDALASMLITTMLRDDPVRDPTPHKNRWDQQDVILIAYGDSIMRYRDAEQAVAVPSEPPLHTLHRFICKSLCIFYFFYRHWHLTSCNITMNNRWSVTTSSI